MRSRPALAALLALALPLALARRPAAPPGPATPAQGMPAPEPLPWRARGSPGAAYTALLQLLREEDAGEGAPAAPQKRDMHDFFVGLMGKRAAEPGRPAGRGSGGSSPRCSPGPPAARGAPLRAASPPDRGGRCGPAARAGGRKAAPAAAGADGGRVGAFV
ncbi:tachykinin-3 [Calonectris borealis]|uniref:tachykinin-3 n=1 Tax=Calonectris borealis TaxID=1323832 RepID=UPI003F4B73DB